jgi:hypothetical protein
MAPVGAIALPEQSSQHIWVEVMSVRLAMLGVIMSTLFGCAAPVGVGGRTVLCSVAANDPHESTGTPGSIGAKVKFWCDPPGVERFWLRIRLEVWIAGGWSPIGIPAEEALVGVATIGSANKPLVRQATTPCVDGKYRTVVDAVGYANGDIRSLPIAGRRL